MSRRSILVLIAFAFLLGALALWRGLPAPGGSPPNRREQAFRPPDAPPGAHVEVPVGKTPPSTANRPAAAISYARFRVRDAGGTRLRGVRLRCESPLPGEVTEKHEWLTAADGTVTTAVEALPGSKHFYTAYPGPAHEGVPTTVRVVTQATTEGPVHDIVLEAGARVLVHLAEDYGSSLPVAGRVLINVTQEGYQEWREGPWDVYSGPPRSGPYAIHLLPDRPFTLRVHSFDHGVHQKEYGAPGVGESEIRVALTPAASISGRAVLGDGVPLPPVAIRVLDSLSRDVAYAPLSWSGGDSSGFIASGLPAGRLSLLIVCDERKLAMWKEIDLSPGQYLHLDDVPLKPMPRVTGKVLGVDGRPAGGVEVALRSLREEDPLARTVTRQDGSFELPCVPLGGTVLAFHDSAGPASAFASIFGTMGLEVRLRPTVDLFARFDPPVAVRRIEPRISVKILMPPVLCFPGPEAVWTEDHRLAGFRLSGVPSDWLVLEVEARTLDGAAFTAQGLVNARPGGTQEILLEPDR